MRKNKKTKRIKKNQKEDSRFFLRKVKRVGASVGAYLNEISPNLRKSSA
jgi:hypothetical protein